MDGSKAGIKNSSSLIITYAVLQTSKMIISFLSVAIISRLISPGSFGIVAMIAPIIAISGLFQDLGASQLITSRSVHKPEELASLHRNCILTASIACLGVAASAYPLAWFYDRPIVAPLCAAYAISVFIDGLNTFHAALLVKDLRLVLVTGIEISAMLAALIAAILGVTLLPGVWALCLSAVIGTTVKTVSIWIVSPWRKFESPLIGRVSRFQKVQRYHITSANIFGFAARNFDNILIGRINGAAALGLYDRAYKLMLFPLQNIQQPATRMAVPVLSRFRDDPLRMRSAYKKSVGLITLGTVPAIAAAVSTADVFVPMLLGENWRAAAPIFSWLGVAGIAQAFNTTLNWLLQAQNRTRAIYWCSVYTSTIMIVSFVASVKFGPVALAETYAISGWLLRTPVLWATVIRIGPIRFLDIAPVQITLWLAAAITFFAMNSVSFGLLSPDAEIFAAFAISYGLACGLLSLFSAGREILRQIVVIVMQFLQSLPAVVRIAMR